MREIKFRAWDKKLGLFQNNIQGCYDNTFDIDGLSESCFGDYLGDNLVHPEEAWDRFDVLQYTGLKDCEGKEIWEGDILEDSDGERCIVQYKGSGFWAWDLNLLRYNGDIAGWINYDTKVIGNIYENQELVCLRN